MPLACCIYVCTYLAHFYAIHCIYNCCMYNNRVYICLMILITFLFPNALMLGVEFFEENDDLQFNEFNLYLFFVCIAYRWRSDGGKIDNLEL